MIGARSKSMCLSSIVALFVALTISPPARAAEKHGTWFPVGPGAEGNIFSKVTTGDPFELQTDGPTDVRFDHIDIPPGGTTGSVRHQGAVVISVVEGAATVRAADRTQCASRTVNAGAGVIQPAGSIGQIRNEATTAAELFVVYIDPSGAGAAAATTPGPCGSEEPTGAVTKTLARAVIEAPLTGRSTGSSDIYVAAARVAPHGQVAWHVQHRPLLAAVDQGTMGLHIAHDGHCELTAFPTGKGFYEPADMVHEVRNDTEVPGLFYALAFAETPRPFLAPAAPPKECEDGA